MQIKQRKYFLFFWRDNDWSWSYVSMIKN